MVSNKRRQGGGHCTEHPAGCERGAQKCLIALNQQMDSKRRAPSIWNDQATRAPAECMVHAAKGETPPHVQAAASPASVHGNEWGPYVAARGWPSHLQAAASTVSMRTNEWGPSTAPASPVPAMVSTFHCKATFHGAVQGGGSPC